MSGTSSEERLAALEAAFATVEVTSVGSMEELARFEHARAARHFGFAPANTSGRGDDPCTSW